MSNRSKLLVAATLLARVASAEPDAASLPWQLRPVTTRDVVAVDTAAAVFRDSQGNVAIAETTGLFTSYHLSDRWAPMIRLGFVGNNAPGAALDGASFANPIVGATYTRTQSSRRLAVFAALALPIGTGGGNDPDPRAARTNAASITARPVDEPMYEINYATAILGADVTYAKRGVTVQAETTLLQSLRVRGDKTAAGADAARTRATIGAYASVRLGSHVSLGADLSYRRWLSHPAMLDVMNDPRFPSGHEHVSALTGSIGARVHFGVGRASVHPGLSYTRGFDGFGLHGPMNITKQTNAIGLAVPVLF